MSVAAQVDFKHTRGVFRGVLTEAPPRREHSRHPRRIASAVAKHQGQARSLEAPRLKEQADLNASRANVLTSFLHFGQRECAADRYVIFFYGHGYGPMGLFFDAESDDASDKSTMALTSLADSLQTGGRAAVIVFRAVSRTRSKPPTSCATRESTCSRHSRSCRSPASGRGATFVTSLMPGATSGDVGRPSGGSWRSSWRPRESRPVRRRPLLAHRPWGRGRDRRALEGAGRRARGGARRPRRASACAAALEGARIGYPDDVSGPGDPALLDVPTMCDNLRGARARPGGRSRRERSATSSEASS